MTLEKEAAGMYFDACMQDEAWHKDVCCCGDDMKRHPNPMYCGHSPLSAWDYARHCYIEDAS